jgi:hypothetical protein
MMIGNAKIVRRTRAILQAIRFRVVANLRPIDIPDQPHLDPDSVPVFLALQKAATHYVEFGSGGSTVQAARLGLSTVSVESDPAFARSVRRCLPKDGSVTLLDAGIGIVGAWGTPIAQRPTPARLRRWRRYIDRPLDRCKSSGYLPDLALVDGRFRRACTLEVARRVILAKAQVTIFFDDYYDRDSYALVESTLGKPRRIGRSAIFEIDGANRSVIDPAVVEDALHDVL